MEAELLKTLAQVAGIGGIALGVFRLLFRDVIRKRIFPQLTRQQAYRILVLALVLTWSVAIAGIVAWIFFQTLFNMGSMVGLMPITGLPLPFISYGGTSLIVLMAASGVIANISTHTTKPVRRRRR